MSPNVEMPAHREPKSLRKLCLIWYFNTIFDKREQIDAKYVPIEIVDDIMQLLIEAQANGAHINQVYRILELHGHHARRIHLEFKEWINVHPMKTEILLRLISTHTNPFLFKYFSIFGHSIPWNTCDLVNNLMYLNGLSVLKLYVHNLNDEVLETIAKYCRNLEELYLQGMNFSNKSIMMLAGINENGLKYSDQFGCNNLRVLMMLKETRTPPKFTYMSIACLLQHLSKIEAIKIPHFCLTRALMRLSKMVIKQLPSLAYYSGNFSTTPDSDSNTIADILQRITRLSPFLTNVNITLDMKTSFESLIPLSKLQHLHSFTITKALRNHSKDYSDESIDIDKHSNNDELYAIIARIGPKLNHLELHNIFIIDLKHISILCPNLFELEVTNAKQIINKSQLIRYEHNIEIFKNLKHLKLFAHSDNRITRNNLIDILSYCQNLRFLQIGWCYALDNQTIDKLLSLNQFKFINHIEFHELSESFTIDSVMQIVITRIRALNMHLLYCDGINCADIEKLRQFIEEFNLDLTVKYFYD